jgi:hypothetical protein
MRREDRRMLGIIGWRYKNDGGSRMNTDPCFSDPDATLDQLRESIEGDGMHEGYEDNHAFILEQYQAIKYRPRLVRAVRVPIRVYVYEDGVWSEYERFPMRDPDEVTDVSYYREKETAKE